MKTISVVVASERPADVLRLARALGGSEHELIIANLNPLRLDPPTAGAVVVPTPGVSVPAALATGVGVATGDVILFLDERAQPDPGLLEGHRVVHEQQNAVVAGCVRLTLADRTGSLARVVAAKLEQRAATLARDPELVSIADCCLEHLSIRRTLLIQQGGLPVAAGAATAKLVCAGALELGAELRYTSAASIRLPVPRPRKLLHRARQEGAGDARVLQKHAGSWRALRLAAFLEGRQRERLGRLLLLSSPLRPVTRLVGRIDQGLPDRVGEALLDLAYWEGARAALGEDDWLSLTRGTRILMYHAIAGPDEHEGRFVLPESGFRRQLAWLRRRGYRILPLDELAAARAAGVLPPPRSVVLTFDDGYRDNLTIALPALEQAAAHATLFAVTGQVGEAMDWAPIVGLAGRPLLTWEELGELEESGVFTLGAHSITHRPLTELTPAEARQEVAGSADALRARGIKPIAFAYPGGRFNPNVEAAVAEAGLPLALTVEPGAVGPRSNDLRLPRHEIWGTDRLVTFALIVALGYTPRRGRRR